MDAPRIEKEAEDVNNVRYVYGLTSALLVGGADSAFLQQATHHTGARVCVCVCVC